MNIISNTAMSGSAQIWSGASAPMSPTQKMAGLFDQIDSSGSGSISKSQFEQAFQTLNPPGSFQKAGADAIWSKLDPNGTGVVSKQDFVNTMTTQMKQLRGHHHHHEASATGAASVNQSAALLSALGQPTSGTASNSSDPVGSIIDLIA